MIGGIYFAGAAFAGLVGLGGPPPPIGPIDTTVGISIGGVPVTARVRMKGVTIHDILNDAPNTASLVVEGDGPAVGQSLRITLDAGALVLFAGQVQTVAQSFGVDPDVVAWAVTAIDDTATANARRPFGTWVQTSATTIAQAITTTFAPGFSAAGIAGGLPPVSIIFDGADPFIACLTRLASLIGGYAKIEDGTVFLFQVDTGAPPDPIAADHCFLFDPPISATIDSSQLRTRVYGKGYGENITADLLAGETLVPIENGVTFPTAGLAIAGTKADAAQSERLAYTGRELAAGGTLVGPGATPTTAPILGLAAGTGVTTGRHDVAVVFVTATGKSLAGPFASIDVGVLAPPPTAPTAATATNGTGPDQGSHDYAASFVTAYGETVAGPISNAIATSAQSGQLPNPGPGPLPDANGPTTGNVEVGGHLYRFTFTNALGETDLSTHTQVVTYMIGGQGSVPPISGPTTGTTGGGLTPGKLYYYVACFFGPNGETASYGLSPHDAQETLLPGQNAINIAGIPTPAGFPAGAITGRYIYRHEDNNGSWVSGPFFRVGTINNTDATTFLDTMAQGTAATGPSRTHSDLVTVSTLAPRTIPITNLTPGPAGTTGRRLYRSRVGVSDPSQVFLVASINNNTATTFNDTIADASLGALGPQSNTTGTAVQRVPVSNIPIGPPGVTGRKLYRRFNGTGTFKLVTTLADNVATTFQDTIANAALGANALTTATAIGNQIAVAVPVGPATVTQRELYMSPVGSTPRKLALVVANNTATTATITIADASLAVAAAEPIADTSGLQQPQGQVNAGATALPVASTAPFRATGGWVALAGDQVVRYTGITGATLSGIPAAGAGAITTTVIYGAPAIPAPMLTGVTGITVPYTKGAPIHLWVQRDHLAAQAEQAARAGGTGVIEHLLVDTRRGADSLTARCDADLALFARPLVTVAYATRDTKTKSGKLVTVDLASPRIDEVLTIQEVTITEIDIVPGLAPRYTVTASNVRFSLEDTLRRLIAGGQIVGGST